MKGKNSKGGDTNLRRAIVEIAKELESVFKKYSRQTRTKAWDRLTSKDGEKEVRKILNDPARPINTFQKLATESGLVEFKKWIAFREGRVRG